MALTTDQMYKLLPAIYRLRDIENGEALLALFNVIGREAKIVEDDIARLYDNWFIETCDEWVVPYIGDLLGVRGLHAITGTATFSRRSFVANTLSYRRRKGTVSVLEQLARDTTGWPAKAVEFFQLLEWTQNVNHVRRNNLRTPDLRKTNELELIDTAFDIAAHTADIRRIDAGRARHNIQNIGIFLWRLQSYAMERSTARQAATPNDGRYLFDPIGFSQPLFNRPRTEESISHRADETNVPTPLRRRPLYDELEGRRQAIVDGTTQAVQAYFGSQPVLEVFVRAAANDPFVQIPPQEIMICNLSEPPVAVPEVWRRPPTQKAYTPKGGTSSTPLPIQVAVDPTLGRIAFPAGTIPNEVLVSYSYGFSGDVGGGPYNRRESLSAAMDRQVVWQRSVGKEVAAGPTTFNTLKAAVAAWNSLAAGSFGVISILDSHTYAEDLTGADVIKVPAGSRLLIVAAEDQRPQILGDIAVVGTAPSTSITPGELFMNGLWIEGDVTVVSTGGGNLGVLDLAHCTVAPGVGQILVNTKNEKLNVGLLRTISGPIQLKKNTAPQLSIVDSIVDGTTAIAAPTSFGNIQSSTILGTIDLQGLEAGNCIFRDRVDVERKQTGCVRFSYVPPASKTPQRYRCQPDLATQGAKKVDIPEIEARLVPSFNSVKYRDPSYTQLRSSCAEEIRTGAEDASEMGVWRHLMQPQREANLRTSLDEYLRFGLEAGLILVT